MRLRSSMIHPTSQQDRPTGRRDTRPAAVAGLPPSSRTPSQGPSPAAAPSSPLAVGLGAWGAESTVAPAPGA
ncbi:hypothetical protein [Pseudobythopirellula maris]|uniref:hypothetical protein n=1 Tax=Pseudobythopirellula maris TaxID=2527991 RepID=UPI0011B4BD49|nr:hypothetical protein [Pseudobythopirellula maris]